jgi:hypothetical protein
VVRTLELKYYHVVLLGMILYDKRTGTPMHRIASPATREVPMTRHSRPLASLIAGLAVLAAALPASAQGSAQGAPGGAQATPKTYSVQDARSFLKALGPDRTIVLRKGDYKFSSASDVPCPYASWNEVEGGRELVLSGLSNLTIRGADGARIVADCAAARVLVVSNCQGLALDNLRLVRLVKEEEGDLGGSLYAESVEGLVVDRCSIEGPTGAAVGLWDCEGARIKRLSVSGASGGAVAAVYSNGLELSGSKILDCEGYPLVYLEESDGVRISQTKFEGCSGGNFIEIYAESGSVESVVFSDCAFSGNQVDYFCGTDILPATEGCSFEDNSFDENWAEDSVAYYGDESYYGDEADYDEESYDGGDMAPAFYAHDASGLGFTYPDYWELRESEDGERVGLFAPDGDSLVLYVTAYRIPAQVDPERQAKKVFADAAASLVALLKDEMEIDLAIGPDGDPEAETGILSADYTGAATREEGERAAVRIRFLVSGEAVRAFVALAKDDSSFESGADIDLILDSAESLGGEK